MTTETLLKRIESKRKQLKGLHSDLSALVYALRETDDWFSSGYYEYEEALSQLDSAIYEMRPRECER